VAKREIVTRSSDETIARGREIGAALKAPVLVLLSGELGAGKTTLTKGIAMGLGEAAEDDVTSPTFTLVHKYGPRLYHVDLYRIEGQHDFETLGLEDVFSGDAIVIVEWPERVALHVEWPELRIHLQHIDEDRRRICIEEIEPASAQAETV